MGRMERKGGMHVRLHYSHSKVSTKHRVQKFLRQTLKAQVDTWRVCCEKRFVSPQPLLGPAEHGVQRLWAAAHASSRILQLGRARRRCARP